MIPGKVMLGVVSASGSTRSLATDNIEVYAATADTGMTARWDTTSDVWIYNLSTKTLGNYQVNVYHDGVLAGFFLINVVK